MVSGLIIKQNPKMQFEKWITIAGVLDHKKWTDYFDDEPLEKSVNMESLPNVPQKHFVGEKDKVVPVDLAKQWAQIDDIVIIESGTHDDFGKLKIFD